MHWEPQRSLLMLTIDDICSWPTNRPSHHLNALKYSSQFLSKDPNSGISPPCNFVNLQVPFRRCFVVPGAANSQGILRRAVNLTSVKVIGLFAVEMEGLISTSAEFLSEFVKTLRVSNEASLFHASLHAWAASDDCFASLRFPSAAIKSKSLRNRRSSCELLNS